MRQILNVNAAKTSKRPIWIWVITVYFVTGFIGASFLYYAVYSGFMPVDEKQQDFFADMSNIDWIISITTSLLDISATATLFMLKRIAIKLWALNLIFSIPATVYLTITSSYFAESYRDIIELLVSIVIIVTIYFYAKRLDARGYLS